MRLLVIGAGGFIGAHVHGQALAAGLEVVTAGRSPLDGLPGHVHADLAGAPPRPPPHRRGPRAALGR